MSKFKTGDIVRCSDDTGNIPLVKGCQYIIYEVFSPRGETPGHRYSLVGHEDWFFYESRFTKAYNDPLDILDDLDLATPK